MALAQGGCSRRFEERRERGGRSEGSQDLFSSQPSLQSDTGIDITLQLTENVWVQCDDPDCQKWRKIPLSLADNLEDNPWYCSMNPDPRARGCLAPEEDHALYDRLAREAGIKFIMSKLQAGSLVWAKMAGYCSWPAMITCDPDLGEFMWSDEDGDPCSYHVEFLGSPHTHSWLTARQVEVYGHKKIHSSGLDTASQKSAASTKKVGRKPKKGQGRRSLQLGQSKLRSTFRNQHIDAVIAEADFLLKLEPQERLIYTTFKPRQKPNFVLAEKKAVSDACKTCGQNKKGNHAMLHRVRTKQEVTNVYGAKRGPSNSYGPDRKKRKCLRTATLRAGSETRDDVSVDEGISDPTTMKSEPNSSVFSFDSPDQLSQSKLKFRNPLKDKTKEEKFAIDINMYSKNEQAFEHDVRRFMTRNGLKIRGSPVWNNVPIKLFQIFLAVYERGGYHKVTQRKKWTAVYKELTENQYVSSGNVAKTYYQKNLLPYELYIKGEDFVQALTQQPRSQKPSLPPKKKFLEPVHKPQTETQQAPAEATVEPVKKTEKEEPKMFDESQSQSSCSADLGKLLGKLDEDFQAVVFPPEGTGGSGKAIGVKFHDDMTETSGLKYGNAASEFEKAHEPEVDTDKGDKMDLGIVEDKILHEMKALEDELKAMSKDLENM